MSIISKMSDFADDYLRYLDDHSWWFYGIGSAVIFLFFVISGTIASGFSFLFIISMLFAACIIGWPMILVYMLPALLIHLVCFCISKPLEALLIMFKFVIGCLILFFIAMYIHTL